MEHILKKIPIFEDISDFDLENIAKKFEPVNLIPGEILLAQGSMNSYLYILVEGSMEVFFTGSFNEYVYELDFHSAPSIIGEMEFFDRKPLVASVKAKEPCKCFKIHFDDFEPFLHSHPKLFNRLVSMILKKWRNVEDGVNQIIKSMNQTNKSLGDFSSIVSHDLRGPLQTLALYITFLKEDKDISEDSKIYLTKMEKSINKMESLIQGILKYSKAIHSYSGSFSLININEVINEVLDLINPPEDVNIIIQDSLPTIIANKIQMIQVFKNLLENALKYLDKPEKKITINSESRDDVWEFSVGDNGIGIPKDQHKRIMQIFQTIKVKENTPGTGIGLAIVERIVQLHGGTVWIQSDLSKGTIFFFTISKSLLLYSETKEEND